MSSNTQEEPYTLKGFFQEAAVFVVFWGALYGLAHIVPQHGREDSKPDNTVQNDSEHGPEAPALVSE